METGAGIEAGVEWKIEGEAESGAAHAGYALASPVEIDSLEEAARLLEKGRSAIEQRTLAAKRRWEQLCLAAVPIGNFYYRDSLQNIGMFFRLYDRYYGADQMPCELAYWTLVPMEDTLQGIDFIEEYLRRLELENGLLRHFRVEQLETLYRERFPGYRSFFFNLAEPVLENLVSRNLLGLDASEPFLSPQQEEELREYFQVLSDETVGRRLQEALRRVLAELQGEECAMRQFPYFSGAVGEMQVRICTALAHRN